MNKTSTATEIFKFNAVLLCSVNVIFTFIGIMLNSIVIGSLFYSQLRKKLCYVIYPIRVGVLDVVSNSECHEQWRGAAEPLFMALGSWKPSQKHQRGLDVASHTSLDIHSNEAWNYYDYIRGGSRGSPIRHATYPKFQ